MQFLCLIRALHTLHPLPRRSVIKRSLSSAQPAVLIKCGNLIPLMSSTLLSNRLGIGQQVRELSENSAIALVSSWESKLENTVQPTKERANVCPRSWLPDLGGQGDSPKCHPMPTHTALHTHFMGDAVK